MNREEIEKLKKKRATEVRIQRDRVAVLIGKMSLPSIVLMVSALIFSIIFIKDESMIAIIASMISGISMSLLTILNKMSGGADKPDPIVSVIEMQTRLTESLIEHLKTDKNKSTELILDDKSIKVVDGDTTATVGKNLIYGNDKTKEKK